MNSIMEFDFIPQTFILQISLNFKCLSWSLTQESHQKRCQKFRLSNDAIQILIKFVWSHFYKHLRICREFDITQRIFVISISWTLLHGTPLITEKKKLFCWRLKKCWVVYKEPNTCFMQIREAFKFLAGLKFEARHGHFNRNYVLDPL